MYFHALVAQVDDKGFSGALQRGWHNFYMGVYASDKLRWFIAAIVGVIFLGILIKGLALMPKVPALLRLLIALAGGYAAFQFTWILYDVFIGSKDKPIFKGAADTFGDLFRGIGTFGAGCIAGAGVLTMVIASMKTKDGSKRRLEPREAFFLSLGMCLAVGSVVIFIASLAGGNST